MSGNSDTCSEAVQHASQLLLLETVVETPCCSLKTLHCQVDSFTVSCDANTVVFITRSLATYVVPTSNQSPIVQHTAGVVLDKHIDQIITMTILKLYAAPKVLWFTCRAHLTGVQRSCMCLRCVAHNFYHRCRALQKPLSEAQGLHNK